MSDDRFAQPSDAAPDDVSIPDPNDPRNQPSDPPAPIIDLGGEASQGPSRPLGPRRLALLREQMAKHQQEVEQAGAADPEQVDPVLAQQQRRIAELASRAAISSDEDRQLADEAIAQTQSIPPITDEYLAERDAAQAQGDGEAAEDASSLERVPSEDDPAEGAASERAPETAGEPSGSADQETPWSAPVPVVPAAQTQEDDQPEQETDTEAQEGVQPEAAAAPDVAEAQEGAQEPSEPRADEAVLETPETAEATETAEAAGSAEATGTPEAAEPGTAEEPSEESSSLEVSTLESSEDADTNATEESSSPGSAETTEAALEGDEREPSEPVRAVNAQGLELMEPRDYRTGVDWRTPALTLAALLVLALVIVLVFLLR